MNHPKVERCLAGLQAGMFGGGALLLVLMLISALDRRAWWSYPNLLGAYFYGARSIGGGPGWPTVAGVALQFVLAGTGGVLFGGIFGGMRRSRRIAFLGLLWGLVVFYSSEQFYRAGSPVVAAYLPRSASIVAHMIYGVCLAGIGRIGDSVPHGTLVATSPAEGAQANSTPVQDRLEMAPSGKQIENTGVAERAREDNGSRG